MLREWWRRWRDDPFRLADNQRCIEADAGWRLAARSMLTLCLLASLLMRDGFPGALLRAVGWVVAACGGCCGCAPS